MTTATPSAGVATDASAFRRVPGVVAFTSTGPATWPQGSTESYAVKHQLTAERLRELLSYDPETGAFVWLAPRGGTAKRGCVAGSRDGRGYLTIRVDGKTYRAHRLAWLHIHGRWPECEIDHISNEKADNRIANLRQATRAENNQNIRHALRNNASGLLGVYWCKCNRSWRAQIYVGGRRHHLGYYVTAEQAHAAYLRGKAELHPFQTIAEAA